MIRSTLMLLFSVVVLILGCAANEVQAAVPKSGSPTIRRVTRQMANERNPEQYKYEPAPSMAIPGRRVRRALSENLRRFQVYSVSAGFAGSRADEMARRHIQAC